MENYKERIEKAKEFISEKKDETIKLLKIENDKYRNSLEKLIDIAEQINNFNNVLHLLDLLENKEVLENEKDNR